MNNVNNNRLRLTWAFLISLFFCTGCRDPLPDDNLEPNDTLEQATELTRQTPVEARSHQDNPDVFKIEVGDDEVLTFDLESLDGENCPGFTITHSNDQVLYADAGARCRRVGPPKTHDSSVEFEILRDYGYQFRIPMTIPGYYYLTIIEGSNADNMFRYHWDYRLVVMVE